MREREKGQLGGWEKCDLFICNVNVLLVPTLFNCVGRMIYMKENYNNKIAPFKFDPVLARNIPADVKVSASIRLVGKCQLKYVSPEDDAGQCCVCRCNETL